MNKKFNFKTVLLGAVVASSLLTTSAFAFFYVSGPVYIPNQYYYGGGYPVTYPAYYTTTYAYPYYGNYYGTYPGYSYPYYSNYRYNVGGYYGGVYPRVHYRHW